MVLGRDLGPAIDIVPATTRKVLKANGKVVHRSTVRGLTPDEMADETMTKEREKFNESTEKSLGDSFKYEDFSSDPELEDLGTPSFEPYEDDDGPPAPAPTPEDDDEADPDSNDQYVGAEVVLPIGDTMMNAKVRGRKHQSNGALLDRAHSNPILDTRTYEVEFADGQTTELAANVIAENMFAQCDSEGNQYLLLAGIVDHRKDNSAVEKKDMYFKHGSNLQPRKTTKGVELVRQMERRQYFLGAPCRFERVQPSGGRRLRSHARFRDRTCFCLVGSIHSQAQEQDRCRREQNARYHKRTRKFGIKILKTYEDCVRIDRENGNTL